MVAEAEKTSVKRKVTQKGRMVGKIDLLTRSHARNLYVVKQLSAPEVATQTGLTASQIYNLADREGWAKTRAEIKRKSAEALRLRDEEDIGEMVEAVAIKNKVLTLGTLDAAIETMEAKGENFAKDLQALSVASKNFNGMWREAKQLDVSDSATQGNTVNVMFVGALPRSTERTTVNVTPSVQSVAAPQVRDAQPAIDVSSAAASGSTAT